MKNSRTVFLFEITQDSLCGLGTPAAGTSEAPGQNGRHSEQRDAEPPPASLCEDDI